MSNRTGADASTGNISLEDIRAMSKAYRGKRVNRIATNASTRAGIAAAAADYEAVNRLPFTFSSKGRSLIRRIPDAAGYSRR